MREVIPLSIPVISGNEWAYVKECLDSGWVSFGSYVDRFEDDFKKYVGSKYAVALVNGTSALHLSLITLGAEPEDEVLVPSLTFIATVNVVRYCSASPVFIDCDSDTLCINPKRVEEFLEKETELKSDGYSYNKKTGKRIKVLIVVHMYGHPADMDSLVRISKKYNISLVEDATESLGSEYRGKKTGCFGDVACFSFNANKIITTGGGGMLVTDNEAIAKRVKYLSQQAKSDSIEYTHDDIGYNYRLTNIQSAIGVAQLEKIEEFVSIKRKNFEAYKELLDDLPNVKLLSEMEWAKSNYWLYTLKVSAEKREPLMAYLNSSGIQVRPVWKPIHTHQMYQGFQKGPLKNSMNAYETGINIPCSTNLKGDEVKAVAGKIREFLKK